MSSKSEEDFVKNLDSRRPIKSMFVISEKTLKKGKNNKFYIDLRLSDNTGEIIGRIFAENVKETLESLDEGEVYEIEGTVNEFPRGSGQFNIIIKDFDELSDGKYDLNDFIITSDQDQYELIMEIKNTIDNIKDEHLKELLVCFFDDEKFTLRFYDSPSAKFYHHNYIAGLLEHTVGVLKLCKQICEFYPDLDADLLYTGAILHDIGKLDAYQYNKYATCITLSEEGELLDHLFISCEMVNEKLKKIEMPENVKNKLLHLILSHHGDVKNGWGSPVSPQIPEAVALHHADNLDAKVKGMLQNPVRK
ncbi:MAG: HD domain-containing protein [Methanobacteriaceae archaeon]|jgi:3'-5' exoribonuclease|nr:HD domain-containing protein [Methanobacteriaceae archaeon]